MNRTVKDSWLWPPNVNKNTWGPLGWRWLHMTAISYPMDPSLADAKLAFNRIWDFVAHLPCLDCRRHAIRYVSDHTPNLSDTNTLQIWAWTFHNVVNRRLKKPLMPFAAYTHMYRLEKCWANYSALECTSSAGAEPASLSAGASGSLSGSSSASSSDSSSESKGRPLRRNRGFAP